MRMICDEYKFTFDSLFINCGNGYYLKYDTNYKYKDNHKEDPITPERAAVYTRDNNGYKKIDEVLIEWRSPGIKILNTDKYDNNK